MFGLDLTLNSACVSCGVYLQFSLSLVCVYFEVKLSLTCVWSGVYSEFSFSLI